MVWRSAAQYNVAVATNKSGKRPVLYVDLWEW